MNDIVKIEDPDIARQLRILRAPFEINQISKLPKPYKKDSPQGKCNECGGYHGLPALHLDYVGHAALTDRLLDVDPFWSWEPLAFDADGLPRLDKDGGMWIKLTVCGMTRLGYGSADGKTGGNAVKERIGDALRNAAMRFGAALDLWHKGILHMDTDFGDEGTEKKTRGKINKPDPNKKTISATDGALARLTPAQQEECEAAALDITTYFQNDDISYAYQICADITDADMKTAVWGMLESKVRTALTKMAKEKKESGQS